MGTRLSSFVDTYTANVGRIKKKLQKIDQCCGCEDKGRKFYFLTGDGGKKQWYCESCLKEWGLEPEVLKLEVAYEPASATTRNLAIHLSLETASGQ